MNHCNALGIAWIKATVLAFITAPNPVASQIMSKHFGRAWMVLWCRGRLPGD